MLKREEWCRETEGSSVPPILLDAGIQFDRLASAGYIQSLKTIHSQTREIRNIGIEGFELNSQG